jgi:hypothetical protein
VKGIPLQLVNADSMSGLEIEIDGALVAVGLGLEVEVFRQLMHDSKVSVLCERGTGEDAGLNRVTFYFQNRRFRALVTTDGQILTTEP